MNDTKHPCDDTKRLQKQHLVHCQQERIEYEGIVIEDTSLSPCGRFELTPEQQREMYGVKS